MVKRNHGGARPGAGRPKDSRPSVARLTAKQECFVAEYLVDLCGSQAAIRAGYSRRNASRIAFQLLGNALVREAIDAAKKARAGNLEITAERVLIEIAAMAFYDPASLMVEIGENDAENGSGYRVSDDGKLYGLRGPTDVRSLPETVRRAIVGWSWDRNGNFTVKLADKGRALDQLARHLALYNDRIEIGGMDGLAERLAHAKAQLALADARSSPDPAPSDPDEPPADQTPLADRLARATAALPSPSAPARSHEPQFHSPTGLTASEDWHAPLTPASAGYRPILPLKPVSS